jgi:hypothetical protein
MAYLMAIQCEAAAAGVHLHRAGGFENMAYSTSLRARF